MSGQSRADLPRPWTVYVLVAASLVGAVVELVWAMVDQGTVQASDLLGFPLTLAIAFGLWRGTRWLYVLLLGTGVVCISVLLLVVFIQLFLIESDLQVRFLLGVVATGLWVLLLAHRLTRRFVESVYVANTSH